MNTTTSSLAKYCFGRGIVGPLRKYSSYTLPHARHFPARKDIMLPDGTFEGKVAFITGGGTGIGRAMTENLSRLGATCVISSRRMNVLEQTANDISGATGSKILAVQCDVRKPDDVREAIDNMVEKVGLPDIIINNAAGNFISPTERLSPNAFHTIVDIVLNGTANVTLDVGKRLIAADKGASFLGITATYANNCGSGYVVPSACAKAGVEAMHLSLSAEWAKYGMRFNCIEPGPFYTEGAFDRLDPTGQFMKGMVDMTSTGRAGDLHEIANLAAYIVSDYANYMTGAIIRFDGGEIPLMAGMFNQMNKVTKEQWDMMEKMVRATNKKSKSS